jgi:hypothetical protein
MNDKKKPQYDAGDVFQAMLDVRDAMLDGTPPAKHLSRVPDRPNIGSVYSNCDHELNEELAMRLDAGDTVAKHHAWDFVGEIWKDGDKWFEEIWQYRTPVEVLEADSLRNIIEAANEKYGYR